MDFDIKKIVEQVVEKIKGDSNLMEKFKKNPIQAIESVIGIDLPDDKVEAVIAAVKAKLNVDDVKDVLGNLGGLFGKK